MLVQISRRNVPGTDAFVERVHLRHRSFCITALQSRTIAVDWGMQAEAVRFMARMTRSQLSILLQGRGYFHRREGLIELRPGDFVLSTQQLQEPEGYTGSPCSALLIEWDEDSAFGKAHQGAVRTGTLSAREHLALLELLPQIHTLPPIRWTRLLLTQLRSIGLQTTVLDAKELETQAPKAVARVYAALGDALTQIDQAPALIDVATQVALTERQTNRHLKELERSFGHIHDGWRDFINDARIGWAMQLLSLQTLSLTQVAKLSGYGSAIALSHAFTLRGAASPGSFAKRLAQRWR